MKELTTEEKAKAYDEALKVLHKYDGAHIMFTQDLKEEMFPELKEESEDERIRKHLIKHFGNKSKENWNGVPVKSILDWLEMQGEQKPANKAEPKFHEGDWIVDSLDSVYHIKEIKENEYFLQFYNSYNVIFIKISTIDNDCHLWDITKDAKDGDVLACENGWTCIFKTLVNNETFSSYCFMDNTKWFCETGSECHTLKEEFVKAYNGKIHPATKEQCETLFKAMADAGYTFDFDKKELKKIEQKPEEDEKIRKALIKYYSFDKDGGSHALDNITPKQILAWLEKQGEKKPQCIVSAEAEETKYGKPAWCREDDEHLERILKELENQRQRPINGPYLDKIESDYNWLKFIKERVQPQSRQEWSEEDEHILNEIILDLKVFRDTNCSKKGKAAYQKEIDWLEFLKNKVQLKQGWSEEDYNEIELIACHLDNIENEAMAEVLRNIRDKYYHSITQNGWKPSDEQIGVIEAVINNRSFQRRHLDSLYDDLKKLRG